MWYTFSGIKNWQTHRWLSVLKVVHSIPKSTNTIYKSLKLKCLASLTIIAKNGMHYFELRCWTPFNRTQMWHISTLTASWCVVLYIVQRWSVYNNLEQQHCVQRLFGRSYQWKYCNNHRVKTVFDIYQSPLVLTKLFQHNLINVSYPTACYLYQVMMTLHFLNDVANDAESTQK